MKPTQEQVIAWAREAGGDDWGLFRDFMPEIERLSTLAYEAGRADENEACAKVCEEWLHGEWHNQGVVVAVMIRARREQ